MSGFNVPLPASATTALERFAPDIPRPDAADDPVKGAQEFEAFFIAQMLDIMTQNLGAEGFDGGAGEQQWRSFFNDAVAKEIAKQGGVGIADQVLAELTRLQTRGGS